MVFSRTITEPTYLRGQVDREATTWAMFMKYSSHDARCSGMRDRLAETADCGAPMFSDRWTPRPRRGTKGGQGKQARDGSAPARPRTRDAACSDRADLLVSAP